MTSIQETARPIDTDPGDRSRANRIVCLLILVFSALLTLKYFPGLENETTYAGFAFQAIHPDALQGDPYYGPEKGVFDAAVVVRLSGMYLLPKLLGEIWLDDRFVVFVYLALVAASFLAIDRISVLVGATGLGERLIVLMMFLKDHQILGNKVLLAHDPDINHAFFSISVGFWLIYVALARKGMWTLFCLSALLIFVSVRNAPFAIGAAFLVYAMTGKTRDRAIVAVLFAAGIAVAYYFIVHVVPIAENERLAIWDILYREMEADGNAFYLGFSGWKQVEVLAKNFIVVSMLVAGLIGPWRGSTGMFGLRSVIAMGVALWLVAGLWVNFPPDFMKVPALLGFSVIRLLELAQNLAYIAIPITALQWSRQSPEPSRHVVAFLVIAIFFVLGPGNQVQWAGLLAVSTLAVLGFRLLPRSGMAVAGCTGRFRDGCTDLLRREFTPIVCFSLGLCLTVALSTTIYRNLPAWRTLIATGVYGHAASAPWIGIAEYVRARVPKGKTVLPLHFADEWYYTAPGVRGRGPGNRLIVTRSLATRTGLGIPIPAGLSEPFSLKGWDREVKQFAILGEVENSLMKGDAKKARAFISQLAAVPDYLLVPDVIAEGLIGPAFPYGRVGKVRGYSLLRLQDPPAAGGTGQRGG